MTDLHELGYWLLVTIFFVVLPLLLRTGSRSRGRIDRVVRRWVATLVERLTPVDVPDPLAAQLFELNRRERLRSDLERLRRILTSDMGMSATRQLGNRLAYRQLLADLAESERVAESDSPFATPDWLMPPVPRSAALPSSRAGDYRPVVETLDIRW